MVSKAQILFVIILTVHFTSFILCEKDKTLSRKRRYLTFPEGSSLQLVYDGIIGMVDYTDLFIIGVTCAIAWPLPTEPYDPNMIKELFENETSLMLRNDENVPDDPVIENVDQSYNTIGADIRNDGIGSYWNGQYSSPNKSLYTAPWDDYSRQEFPLERNDYYSPTPKPIRHHLRYIALGKRSIPTKSRVDRFYLNHHRTTRHDLYRSIEKYMNARGKNGTECVRKALCETRQKHLDQTPTSLIGEIVRAIFSLPPSNEDTKHSHLSREYDEAFTLKEDCAEMYPYCKDSLWSADFIF